jgi:hypothetical protein
MTSCAVGVDDGFGSRLRGTLSKESASARPVGRCHVLEDDVDVFGLSAVFFTIDSVISAATAFLAAVSFPSNQLTRTTGIEYPY